MSSTHRHLLQDFLWQVISGPPCIFLRSHLKYPLPGLSTLQRYASQLNMRQGLLTHVLNFMQIAGRTMTSAEKLVVLQFDEVKVKAR
jgi:hypothetical protein